MSNHPNHPNHPILPSAPPDVEKMRQAIALFLEGAGLNQPHPHLEETPQRVAECWTECLIDGYQSDPAALLREQYPTQESGLVLVQKIQVHGICPHHLLPFLGYAHIAYLPHSSIVGFSQLARLVQCLAHRLVLQEDLTQAIARALMEHLKAKGAGCVIEAQHMCMILRSPQHHTSQVVSSSFLGEMESQVVYQQALLSRL